MPDLTAAPITAEAFAPFGDLVERGQSGPSYLINKDRCGRYHDLADIDILKGRAGISLFDSKGVDVPCPFDLVERHPLGSQAFIPLDGVPYLVLVAGDERGVPTGLRAFVAQGHHIVNIHRNIWHGVLTPIGGPGVYAVVDRIGEGTNLAEYPLDPPITVDVPPTLLPDSSA